MRFDKDYGVEYLETDSDAVLLQKIENRAAARATDTLSQLSEKQRESVTKAQSNAIIAEQAVKDHDVEDERKAELDRRKANKKSVDQGRIARARKEIAQKKAAAHLQGLGLDDETIDTLLGL